VAPPIVRTLDQLAVGETISYPSRTLSEAQFLLFSAMTGDREPVHLDRVLAAEGPFGAPVAHGLMLAAMTALGGSYEAGRIAVLAILEQSTTFRRPALLGDTVTCHGEIIEIIPREAGRGLLRMRVEVRNQRQEALLQGEHLYLVSRDDAQNDTSSG
jgi:3-hydroxybutyryl-CoA dehydratase